MAKKKVNKKVEEFSALENSIKDLIRWIGDDPDRPGLKETPGRVLKAWQDEWGAGYNKYELRSLVKLFVDESPQPYNQMVIVDDIEFFSSCEHHLAPFFGRIAIGYIPSTRGLVGLSKLARVVHHFSRRLQVQERMTEEIAAFLFDHVSQDVAVSVEATHMCMASRGVRSINARTRTSALRGAFLNEAATAQEFFAAAHKGR